METDAAESDGTQQVLHRLLQGMLDDAARTGGVGELQQRLQRLDDELWARGRLQRVVVTGGPCGGKSTIMSDFIQMLKERNYLVFTMPEIATEMFNWSGGKMWDDYAEQGPDDDRVWASLQTSLTRVQMAIEDAIVQMAARSLAKRRHGPNPPEGAVVLLDRGVVDNMAYCTPEAWGRVLEELGTTTARLRDGRYDHVLHLVSAAKGAEAFYTLAQAEGHEASARTETAEQARDLDERTQTAWQEARSHYIVGNTGVTWPEKRERAKGVLGMILGDRQPASGQLMQRISCPYQPASAILKHASADDAILWAVSEHVTLTYLSESARLHKSEPGAGIGATLYFYQDLDADGHVVRQHPVDYWTYQQKLRTVRQSRTDVLLKAGGARAAGPGEPLREEREERISFAFGDQRIRCRCLEAQRKLQVEVFNTTSAEHVLPAWLKHKH